MNLDDPVATALRIAALLDRAEIAHALYGGLAVAAYGVARETKDADVAVSTADADRLVALLASDGCRAEKAFDRVEFGGLLVSRTTLLGGDDDVGLNTVDLIEARSPRYSALAIGRALRAPLRDREISILTPEDVVLFKLLSTRERDLADAAALLDVLGDELELPLIEGEVRRLATEIEGHDLESRWARLQSD